MNKTPNYQLNQWDADDRVLRTDFNADNAKIDAVLGAKAEKSVVTALSGRVSAVENSALRLAVGSYVGTGENTMSLDFSQSLGRPPKVLVIPGSPQRIIVYENISTTTVTFNADNPYNASNTAGQTYYYFALG